MSKFQLKMPKLGESVQEATITKWMVSVGDTIEEDDNLLEIATDKVDSEIPSPVDGKIIDILFEENSLVPVGEIIAVIQTDDDDSEDSPDISNQDDSGHTDKNNDSINSGNSESIDDLNEINKSSGKFFSPLVLSIAKKESISANELNNMQGSGRNGRVTKIDILSFVKNRGSDNTKKLSVASSSQIVSESKVEKPLISVSVNAGDEIIEMDRMRKLISQYMVNSKRVSPHVTTMVEADVTNVVLWRTKVKDEFLGREKNKLTYMPIFTEAVAKAIRDFPMINIQVNGEQIIKKQDINIGMAVSLPSGNLIVPVIKNADKLNLSGLAGSINRLANAARNNKLNPDEIQGGTFTITNFGSFKNVMGTPIINQPEVAILAIGSIEKKPAVIETPTGDMIGIRHKMFLSLSYDHRVVDGMLGGLFLRKIADYIEEFDIDRAL